MDNSEGKFIIPQQFNIDSQFDLYLNLVKLDKRKMPSVQLRELRRAFYGAIGINLITQRDKLTEFSDDQGILILDYQLRQVSEYWNKEIAPNVFNNN
jgi:hypothetical protein